MPSDLAIDEKLEKTEQASVQDNRVEEGEEHPELDEQIERLELETQDEHPPPAYAEHEAPAETATLQSSPSAVNKSSTLKDAWGGVTHFAGGLIAHPYEATKHYTVLRHSHGLVYYTGPTTSVAITVFSDQALPPDRKLWLQKRGFSGKTGLKVGAHLGTRSAWIDVTPAIDTTADLLPHADERAWQRDINKFLKKAKDTKNLRKHKPYETNVVRIPHAAEDGYFRIVLCAGRKLLCPSPMFRYVSASLDPGRLRGASLKTLPLELGVKVGAKVANHMANAAAHGALQPATAAYQNQVQPLIDQYNPMGLTQTAAIQVYGSSGAAAAVGSAVGAAGERFESGRDASYQIAGGDAAEDAVRVVGGEEGPQAPYPIRLSGLVQRSSGVSKQRVGVPTADLTNVAEDTLMRLLGVYMGWTSILKAKLSKTAVLPAEAYEKWYPAVITVALARDRQPKVVEQKHASVYLIHDFEKATFFESRLNILIFAYLRPADPLTNISDSEKIESLQGRTAADIAIAKASLNRPAWSVEAVVEKLKTDAADRTFTDRVADIGQSGMRQIDKIPLHKLGVRTDSMGLKDQLIGNGGICVKR